MPVSSAGFCSAWWDSVSSCCERVLIPFSTAMIWFKRAMRVPRRAKFRRVYTGDGPDTRAQSSRGTRSRPRCRPHVPTALLNLALEAGSAPAFEKGVLDHLQQRVGMDVAFFATKHRLALPTVLGLDR